MRYGHRIRLAKSTDFEAILELQKRESNKLGFLPGVALTEYLEKGLTHVAELRDRTIVGYVLGRASMSYDRQIRPITQLTVASAYRFAGIGRLLVAARAGAAAVAGQDCLQAWTRSDLTANAFWSRLGFELICDRHPRTARGKPALLWRYRLADVPDERFRAVPTRGGYRAGRVDGQQHFDFSGGWIV